jgi:hypothetical protein
VFGTRSAHKLMMARILFATMNSMSCDDSASPMNTPSFSFEAIGNTCRLRLLYKPSRGISNWYLKNHFIFS